MTLLQKLSLAAIVGSAAFSVAASIPTSIPPSIPKTILPDNVIRCEPNTGCTSQTLHGHNYKVLNTPRFTVMVAVTHEGSYTRADVSITNKTDAPLNVTPDDFRVEVLTPKPRVLNYVPPANLILPPPLPSAAASVAPIAEPAAASAPAAETATVPAPGSAADVLLVATREKAAHEEADKVASEHHLCATSIPPNEATSGRVYFQRDRHAHLVNVVLPIAGLVFEFPYAMKK